TAGQEVVAPIVGEQGEQGLGFEVLHFACGFRGDRTLTVGAFEIGHLSQGFLRFAPDRLETSLLLTGKEDVGRVEQESLPADRIVAPERLEDGGHLPEQIAVRDRLPAPLLPGIGLLDPASVEPDHASPRFARSISAARSRRKATWSFMLCDRNEP